MSSIINKMRKAKLVVYDFDGVMTDNTAYVFEDGTEAVRINRADGLGIRVIREKGLEQMILSTETNPVVSVRAKKLNLDCIHGVDDKASVLKKICLKRGLSMNEIIYVGNDVNDEEAMRLVGMPIAPSDANIVIRDLAILVLNSKGGEGVIRELSDRFFSDEN